MFFFTQLLLLRLDAHTGCQINDTNRNERTWRWMKVNMLCFPKYNWVNWQWAGFTSHNKHWHSGPECTFSKENNIAFQINNYDNLACFLNFCKHLMVFLCFIRVSQNPKYSTFKCTMVFTKFIQRILWNYVFNVFAFTDQHYYISSTHYLYLYWVKLLHIIYLPLVIGNGITQPFKLGVSESFLFLKVLCFMLTKAALLCPKMQ